MKESLESRGVLGKRVSYPKEYSKELLVAIPRYLNREIYNIEENNLPFVGYDTWHAYELGFITERGLPVAALLKIVIPATNSYIVESKSLKLYLNSFNLSRFGKSVEDGKKVVAQIIKQDLEELLQCRVELSLLFQGDITSPIDGFSNTPILEESIDVESLQFNNYSESPELLKVIDNNSGNSVKWQSELLRSNCKVTHQPDWGTLLFQCSGDKTIDPTSLLKYIVSFRNENHFHEEICEMIFKRISDIIPESNIVITCIYTRRGGIDICPTRATNSSDLPQNLINATQLTDKLLRQ